MVATAKLGKLKVELRDLEDKLVKALAGVSLFKKNLVYSSLCMLLFFADTQTFGWLGWIIDLDPVWMGLNNFLKILKVFEIYFKINSYVFR